MEATMLNVNGYSITVELAGPSCTGGPLAEVKSNGCHLTYANIVEPGVLAFNGYHPRNLWGHDAALDAMLQRELDAFVDTSDILPCGCPSGDCACDPYINSREEQDYREFSEFNESGWN
jgi:hypothetical protein